MRGRVAELNSLLDQLDRCTVVSVVGPGGIGKTTLARACLDQLTDAGSKVVWVELEAARNATDLAHGVARAFGQDADPLLDEALESVAAKRIADAGDIVVILNNFEQLLPRGALTLARWIDTAPEATFLVTSRARLRISLETVYELGPLEKSDGVELFIERMANHRPTGAFTEEDRRTITAIVERLDAIPLAIELAAARTGSLELTHLRTDLERDLSLLDHGPIDVPERHQSITAAVQSSFEDMDPTQLRAISAASVFVGSFTIPDMAALLGSSLGSSPSEAVRLVQALREKSLIFERSAGVFGVYVPIVDFVTRYEPASAFYREMLARHDAWVLEEAGRGRPRRESLGQILNKAVQGQATEDTVTQALRAALHLPLRELVSAEDDRLQSALELALRFADRLDIDRNLVAQTGAILADLRWYRGDLLGAIESATGALSVALALGAPVVEIGTRLTLARARFGLGQFEEALEHLEKARVLASEARSEVRRKARNEARNEAKPSEGSRSDLLRPGTEALLANRRALVEIHQYFGAVFQSLGRRREAKDNFYAARDLARKIGALDLEASIEGSLGTLALDEGGLDAARARLARSRELARRTGQTRTLDIVTAYAGLVEFEGGALETAEDLCAAALQGAERTGNAQTCAVFAALLGAVRATRGHILEAQELFNQAETEVLETESTQTTVKLYSGHLHLARARDALLMNDRHEWQREIGLAEECLASASSARAERLDDVRIAARILERALAKERSFDAPHPMEVPREHTLLLGPDTRWFSVNGGARVDLSRRPLLRKLLFALASERLNRNRTDGASAPESAIFDSGTLSQEQLVGIVWPGETMKLEVHLNRLNVALSTLRSMGLRDIIERHGSGYRIVQAVRIDLIGRQPELAVAKS